MDLDLYTQTLLWAFALSLVFGAIANKSNFCTMGAVSDWINIGSLNRMRSWFLAIAVAIAGVGILDFSGIVDMSLTTSVDSANPPYRSPNFVWLRYLVGGLMFGVGMTLASGCGNKTLVRFGEGNLKSLVVFVVMGFAAWWMLFSNFGHLVFLQWMTPLGIDLSLHNIPGQDMPTIFAALSGIEANATLNLVIALVIVIPLLFWIFRSADFREDLELLVAGLVVGLIVVAAWYLTAGSLGQGLLEELDFMDDKPFFTGAQSMTFVGPAAHVLQYLKEGFSSIFLTFGVALVAGVTLGSFLYTLIFRKVRVEWFVDWKDFMRHVAGASLMGIGGVLGIGCTVGQGITGLSTLALGSVLTLLAIIAGSAATMKYQYYLMMREFD